MSFLDFAITAHVGWKMKLLNAIQNGEVLDRALVSQDNKCDFGKWLYGEGPKSHGTIPEFHDVRRKHKAFHETVASVVDLLIQGNKESAIAMVHTGAYAKASNDLIDAVKKLKSVGGS